MGDQKTSAHTCTVDDYVLSIRQEQVQYEVGTGKELDVP